MMVASRLVAFFACLKLMLGAATGWCAAGLPAGVFDEGDRLLHRSDFHGALRAWERNHSSLDAVSRQSVFPELLLRKAGALRRIGHVRESAEALREAFPLVKDNPRLAASILDALGATLVASGAHVEARQHLDRSLAIARSAGLKQIEASALNSIGYLHASQDDFQLALDAYRQSARVAEAVNERTLQAQALINAARAAERLRDRVAALDYASRAEYAVGRTPHGLDKTLALLAIGELRTKLAGPNPSEEALAPAHAALQEALETARGSGDVRSESYALGYLGYLYFLQNRLQEALELNSRAVFAAEQAAAAESLYRWYWQRGKILRARGDNASALNAYRRALATLQSIRHDITAASLRSQSSFRESLGPLFFEVADLLLQAARGTADRSAAEKLLVEARDTVELSKVVELEDYFKDTCVAAHQAKTAGVTSVDQRTAVVYPILLPDRVELLVSFPSGMRQYAVAVEGRAIAAVARQFRYRLERRTTRHFIETSQRLYGWLIRPIEEDLAKHGIETLVFVPESGLRSIPMAALHDGQRFLVSRYAVAMTPGLTLTDPRPLKLDTRRAEALLTGLSEAVQGFAALPDVRNELAAVRNIQGGKVLVNQEYVLPTVEKEFSQQAFAIVHVASHGEFHGDPKRTFLLTYDGKLTMDNLERLIAPSRFRDQPIELLTLSACETAAGDDRAALGLAGVAVKAGARSALASLWSINDESTALLIEEFYRGLKQGLSKAKSLQQAQMKMLADSRFKHPGYWAPFLLIGNWL